MKLHFRGNGEFSLKFFDNVRKTMFKGIAARKTLPMIVLMLALASAVHAQAAQETKSFDIPAIVKEASLMGDQADATTKLLDKLGAQVQDSSKSMIAIFSQKKPEQLLDPQVMAKISQVQKAFTLKFEKFQLDLAEIVPQEKADEIAARTKSSIPKILFDAQASAPNTQMATMNPAPNKPAEVSLGSAPIGAPPSASAPKAAGSANLDLSMSSDPAPALSGMGDDKMDAGGEMSGMMDMMSNMMSMMSSMGNDKMPMANDNMPMGDNKMPMGASGMGMGASASSMNTMPTAATATNSMNDSLVKQVQATNAIILQMISSLATQTGAAAQAQIQLLSQLIANQNTTLQLLLGGAASQGTGATSGSMPMQSSSSSSSSMGMM